MSDRKIDFIKNFFNHMNWIQNPAIFKMGKMRFSPDFYDQERGVYIHVVNTRQRYHQIKDKVQQIRDNQGVSVELRRPSGELIDESKRVQWVA
jgi:hypothetical protein